MKSYTRQSILQRITACILLTLIPWFFWNLFCLKDLKYWGVLKNFNCKIIIFFILVSGFYHGYLGIKTICIDYIPSSKTRSVIIFMTGSIFSFLCILGTICLINIAMKQTQIGSTLATTVQERLESEGYKE